MRSKNQTDTAGSDTQSMSVPTPTPWKLYKSYINNVKVEARLIQEGFPSPVMEVRESRGDDFNCPQCGTLLSKGNGREIPMFLLTTALFHERYRPIDMD